MFQKNIASNRFTLVVVSIFAAIVWVVYDMTPHQAGESEEGVFSLSFVLGFALCALAVYLMAELNTRYVLLRISSRMLSTCLVMLCAAASMLHHLSPAHLMLVCAVASYFPMFATYQRPYSTTRIFLEYLFIGLASYLFPQVLYLVPVYWVVQGMLRALTFRSWVASLLGIITPYWFLVSYAYITDKLHLFTKHFGEIMSIGLPDYTLLSHKQILVGALSLVLFILGGIDFSRKNHLDKTRVRSYYYAVLLLGASSFVWLFLQPQYFNLIIPFCLVHAAMIGGHFVGISYGKVQNIITIILSLCAVVICFIH